MERIMPSMTRYHFIEVLTEALDQAVNEMPPAEFEKLKEDIREILDNEYSD